MPKTKDHDLSPAPKPSNKTDGIAASGILSEEEIEALRQDKMEAAAFCMKRFGAKD